MVLLEGTLVYVTDDKLNSMSKSDRNKYTGRIGEVKRIFTPLGGTGLVAEVCWGSFGLLSKKMFVRVFNVRDLEIVE